MPTNETPVPKATPVPKPQTKPQSDLSRFAWTDEDWAQIRPTQTEAQKPTKRPR